MVEKFGISPTLDRKLAARAGFLELPDVQAMVESQFAECIDDQIDDVQIAERTKVALRVAFGKVATLCQEADRDRYVRGSAP